ncbi:GNAT family N-acetyltransferase [Cohnella soli]|uniref:GNAT family N-acetyltransferase n=1 Tax=Cohnella soli TaxID=425005 RepID=A0ABW0HQA9_9BACL
MNYKFIEELSLNHWPALTTLLCDGWVLRLAEGYTKRANSVSALYGTTFDTNDKIAHCESVYATHRLPATFKITPFVHPANLDDILAARGYSLVDQTSVQTLELANIREPQIRSVRIVEAVDSEWLDDYCRLNQIKSEVRVTMERMISLISTPIAFISFYERDQVVAVGFGVVEREYIGLYDIVTDAGSRNRGFGEQMILNLLEWGKKNGAKYSYLAVVADNAPAMRLYSKLGYSEAYRYWYRIMPNSNKAEFITNELQSKLLVAEKQIADGAKLLEHDQIIARIRRKLDNAKEKDQPSSKAVD